MIDQRRSRCVPAYAAFTLYAAISIIFIDHGLSLTRNILGAGSDPFAFIWFLRWWPWAMIHHLNPVYTHLVWQPLGIYFAWVTSVPLLSLIGLPFTLLSGPVLAYNVLNLSAPVLSAFAAYHLCLKITKAPLPAIIGGYLFGFSSYEMAQSLAALNLSFTVFLPLLLLLVLMRLNNEINRQRFMVAAGALLICEFLVCIEIFAMVFVFGGITWLFALHYLRNYRPALRRLFMDGLATAPFVIIVLSPVLGCMYASYGFVHLPDAWPYYFTTDLVNIFVPTCIDAFHGALFSGITSHFKSDIQEQDAYIGLPLLAIVFFFAKTNRNMPAGRLLVVTLIVTILASFGPRLWIDGDYSRLVLPWMFAVRLPLISAALPARFALFSSLVIAIIAALWLAEPPPGAARNRRLALGLLACLFLLPAPHPWMKIPHSTFFQPGKVQAKLGTNVRILVLPFAINGPSSFWQEESGFSFSQTGGYLGFPPAKMQHFKAVGELFGNYMGPNFLQDLRQFVAATNTQYIVAGPGTSPAMTSLLAQLHWKMQQADDVMIYTVPQKTVPANG
jgi:hypothetical protein